MLTLATSIPALGTNSGLRNRQNIHSMRSRTSSSHEPPANPPVGDNIWPDNSWDPDSTMGVVTGSANVARTPEKLEAQRVYNHLVGI